MYRFCTSLAYPATAQTIFLTRKTASTIARWLCIALQIKENILSSPRQSFGPPLTARLSILPASTSFCAPRRKHIASATRKGGEGNATAGERHPDRHG
ncbi:hypothetical protein [Accumulibacter sp.]|uniref:hypothetical protein n=1 Tax=Accumulibacter sp. TaxID=2053492 RepID=UPI0025D47BB5|nr:hypothetical protein [Accumulibacter sp.]MCP5228199.1 hypothetical protein [Accumulibacter sp.]